MYVNLRLNQINVDITVPSFPPRSVVLKGEAVEEGGASEQTVFVLLVHSVSPGQPDVQPIQAQLNNLEGRLVTTITIPSTQRLADVYAAVSKDNKQVFQLTFEPGADGLTKGFDLVLGGQVT